MSGQGWSLNIERIQAQKHSTGWGLRVLSREGERLERELDAAREDLARRDAEDELNPGAVERVTALEGELAKRKEDEVALASRVEELEREKGVLIRQRTDLENRLDGERDLVAQLQVELEKANNALAGAHRLREDDAHALASLAAEVKRLRASPSTGHTFAALVAKHEPNGTPCPVPPEIQKQLDAAEANDVGARAQP